MKLTLKNSKISTTKKYIKNTNLFFFINGINTNSSDSIKTQQKLLKNNLKFYKIFNKTSTKILKNSIYKTQKPVISGVTFFVKFKSNKKISKKNILNNFENLMFIFLKLKLNNSFYLLNQFNNINVFSYKKKKLLLYQFMATNIKHYF
nr:hypothetical protein orf147 [Schizostauron trachyderma]